MKYFLLGFALSMIVALVPEAAFAVTFEESSALNDELYTILIYGSGVFVFVIGWLVGTLT